MGWFSRLTGRPESSDPPAADLETLALEAIAYRPSGADIEASSRPPYPAPAALVSFQTAAMTALRERLEQGGPDPMCTTRLYEAAQPWSRSAQTKVSAGRHGSDVADLLCLLLAGGLVSVECVSRAIDVAALPLVRRNMQRALVYRLIADGDMDAAEAAAESDVLADTTWVGWRAIGEHHARHGDAESFLRHWPTYGSRSKRTWIDRMRRDLVDAVSRAEGWQAAVALTSNTRIGTKANLDDLRYVALHPYAESHTTREVDVLLTTSGELDAMSEVTRLRLLVAAMLASVEDEPPGTDHPDLAWVLDRIVAIDPLISKEQSRRRDWLLAETWPLIGREETLKRVRGAARAPATRRELTGVAR